MINSPEIKKKKVDLTPVKFGSKNTLDYDY